MSGSAQAGAATSRIAEPGLTVAAVARRLGVSPSTLRTWDRRYGLGPTNHAGGTHRRYSALDLARLRYMQALVRSGVTVAEAAALAVVWEGAESPAQMLDPGVSAPSPELASASATALVRGLGAAAAALDSRAMARLLRTSLLDRGAVWTWDEVLCPVLVSVGRSWERTGRGVEVEHLLSQVAGAELTSAVERSEPRSVRPALLACAPEETHALPLFALAAALAERGVEPQVLGPRTPVDALASAVRRVGPSAVFVWAYLPVDRPDLLLALPAVRPSPVVIAGGPGWPTDLPPGIGRATDISSAVTTMLRAA